MGECQHCGAGHTQLFLCRHCIPDLRHQLLRIPDILADLHDAAVGNIRLTENTGHTTGTHPAPRFDGRARELIDDIENTVGQWARGTAHLNGYTITRWRHPYRHPCADEASSLAAHVLRLANDPDIGELCADLDKYLHRYEHIVDRKPPPQFCGPCPTLITDHRHCTDSCSRHTHECATSLSAARDAIEIRCPQCGITHNIEKLLTTLLARADHFRGTLPEIHRICRMLGEPVGLSTLYRWAEPASDRRGSGKIRPAGYLRADKRCIGLTRRDPTDTPLYRVSDVRKQRRPVKTKAG